MATQHAHMMAFRKWAQKRDLEILSERHIDHGHQLVLVDGNSSIRLNFYRTGRILVQGRESPLKNDLVEWANLQQGEERFPESGEGDARPRGTRAGVDESGKGDVFGPLVVAGVALDGPTERQMLALGARDSKSMTPHGVRSLAAGIRVVATCEVLTIRPPDYNSLYEKFGNLNHLLAWAHGEVISSLARRVEVVHATFDRFGPEELLASEMERRGCRIPIEQMPHAEKDVVVAAASVLARAAFIEAMDDYSRKAGFRIPPGASSEGVSAAARWIFEQWGEEGLRRIAKMHFKTVREIAGG